MLQALNLETRYIILYTVLKNDFKHIWSMILNTF